MSNTEEYLDDLLGSLSDSEEEKNTTEKALQEDTASQSETADIADLEGNSPEDEAFLKQFEQELSGSGEDDLTRQFEQELNEEEGKQKTGGTSEETQALIDDLDDILNGSGETKTQAAPMETEPEMPVAEAPEAETKNPAAEPEIPTAESGTASVDEKSEKNAAGSSDDDLMALLSGMTGSDELADAGVEAETSQTTEMPETQKESSGAGEFDESQLDDVFSGLDGLDSDNIFGEDASSVSDLQDLEEKEPVQKNEKEAGNKKSIKDGKKKEGFLQKLSLILFGEDDEEEELAAGDENRKLLKELDAAGETDAGAVKPEDPKEKKKREKAEKKARKKQEKEAKKAERAQKAANKPKKEKKPKEKDNTPPLPKKPVILIAVMAVSIFALVLLGSNAVGYSVFKGEAQDAYKQGDYVTAYTKLNGAKIKESDDIFYNKTALLAAIQEEYESYQSMMQINEPEMALDCLIRGIGRCDNNADKAEEYGVTAEVGQLKDQIVQTLSETFGVDEQQALEVYGQRSRTDYTLELKKILKASGME